MKELTKEHLDFWIDLQKNDQFLEILQHIEDTLVGDILSLPNEHSVDKVGYIKGVRDSVRDLLFRQLTNNKDDNQDIEFLPYDIELKKHGN